MTQQKIGRYEIKSELGRGGMATVYKAYDPRFEREVAVKVLPRELLHDPQFRVRFERDAKTIAALEHQAIVPVYDVGDDDGQPYFVMRCMTGGSLGDTIANGPIPLSTTARIMERLAPALDEAHFKGIVHRDLKPGNILLDRAGEPFISDFGIAKMTQSQNTSVTGNAIIGTPAYMSPEQAQGEQVDGRSDVYALGVIIYEMLVGAQPYQATTPMAVVVKHITDPIPHILDKSPSLPVAIEAVIEKAMAKNPADRFASAGELSAALSAVASGQNADDAIRTATITATRIAAARTQLAPAKTRIAAQPTTGKTGGMKLTIPVFIGAGLVGLCILLVVALGVLRVCPPGLGFMPWCTAPVVNIPLATATTQAVAQAPTQPVVVALTSAATLPPTEAPTDVPTVEVPATLEPSPSPQPAGPQAVGGADKVAFIAGNEVWLMNIDGSDLHALTSDQAPKKRLQWIPGTNKLVFVSGTNVNIVDADTLVFDNIMAFPFAKSLDEFRISPDGKQVALSLNREMYVVPFDLATLKAVRGRDGLVAMKGCLNHVGQTPTAILLKEFRWSQDSKLVSWLFTGVDGAAGSAKQADMVRIYDISSCDPKKLGNPKDEFPGNRFTPEGYASKPTIPSFDWDGTSFFLMNTLDRNDGWGFLYSYTSETHRGNLENPISTSKAHCCYRDARWSPDGNYIFFAFMNKDASDSPEQFYYIPVTSLSSGGDFKPIPMPDNFFKNPKEAIQPALHTVLP